jgi:FMN-dependent NADH-azoreductase
MKLLHIDSSVLGDVSVSRRLSADVVARLKALHPDLEIVRRDLAADPVPHMSAAYIAATRGPQASAPRPDALAADFAVLDEFLAADIVVIGAPMYNFGLPSNLKAWIDRLAVPQKTFAYVDGAPKGLCGGKRIIVASSRGGIYTEGPYASADHQEPYLRVMFGFLGITDIAFVRAEGLSMPDKREEAIAAAEAEAAQLAA